MKVGIFGGSFNPPHIAHLILVESIRDQFDLDQILWIPGYIPPHKTHLRLADASHRLAMTRLATANNPHFTVSDMEIERAGVSFTVDTVRLLQQENPDTTYYLVIGEDSLFDFMTWRDPESILEMVQLLVYRRPGKHHNEPDVPAYVVSHFPDRVLFADAPLLEISSVSIRKRLKAGKSIQHRVPDAILDYILKHNLYGIE